MLREIAPDLWVTEEPLRYLGFEMGRRMAVVRLADGGLLVHSPVRLRGGLKDELAALGDVRFVVPASILHGHLYMEQYQEAYPRARLFSVPGLERKRPDLCFDGELGGSPEPEWSGDLDQKRFDGHRVAGRVLNEVEFFHRKTHTLIAGDLCFNIGPEWPLRTRLLAWGRGCADGLGRRSPFDWASATARLRGARSSGSSSGTSTASFLATARSSKRPGRTRSARTSPGSSRIDHPSNAPSATQPRRSRQPQLSDTDLRMQA